MKSSAISRSFLPFLALMQTTWSSNRDLAFVMTSLLTFWGTSTVTLASRSSNLRKILSLDSLFSVTMPMILTFELTDNLRVSEMGMAFLASILRLRIFFILLKRS